MIQSIIIIYFIICQFLIHQSVYSQTLIANTCNPYNFEVDTCHSPFGDFHIPLCNDTDPTTEVTTAELCNTECSQCVGDFTCGESCASLQTTGSPTTSEPTAPPFDCVANTCDPYFFMTITCDTLYNGVITIPLCNNTDDITNETTACACPSDCEQCINDFTCGDPCSAYLQTSAEPTTLEPTGPPTNEPTEEPTVAPINPTRIPTRTPTRIPTEEPTHVPTTAPTQVPTSVSTQVPTSTPVSTTLSPTLAPTIPIVPTLPTTSSAPINPTTSTPTNATQSPGISLCGDDWFIFFLILCGVSVVIIVILMGTVAYIIISRVPKARVFYPIRKI